MHDFLAGETSLYVSLFFFFVVCLSVVRALICFCQTPGYVFRLGVEFVLPLSQQEQEQEEPPTKMYQNGEC